MVSVALSPKQALQQTSPSPVYALTAYHQPMVWAIITGLMLIGISMGLLTAPEIALQYWYLLAAPVIVAAFHFGTRGVVVTAGLNTLILCLLFQSAGKSFAQVQRLIDTLFYASLSPGEAQRLALQFSNLRLADPETDFARALIGLTLVIAGCFLLGSSVDSRTRSTRLLQHAFSLLRQYFSPQIIETILIHSAQKDPQSMSRRKEITVLFADLRGFTTLAERLEPEETAQLLNEFFAAMAEEIFREDGTLDKYLGDGLMAFFGDPVAHEDHAERAFRAALAMQRRMPTLKERWEAQGRGIPGMGIGISSGIATVGNMGAPGRVEYTAIGSTVNIAARLTALALADQILTTQQSYGPVQDRLEGIPLEPIAVKGVLQPVPIVEITGRRVLTPSSGPVAVLAKIQRRSGSE